MEVRDNMVKECERLRRIVEKVINLKNEVII